MELFKTVKGIMTRGNFITTKRKAKGTEIALALIRAEVSGLPVVNTENRVVGVITEFDLIAAIKEGKKLKNVTAGHLMSKNLVTVTEETSIDEVIELLVTKKIIRVPVVDTEGRLIGIVSRRDILKAVTETEGAPQVWF
jgi:CBS domain-containing protein